MRIAILSDIHGNLHALEAVLDHAERDRPDALVVAGDVVIGGPDSLASWQLVQGRGFPRVRGNHERYLLAAAAGDPAFDPLNWAPARWNAARFPAATLAEIAALPMTLRLAGTEDLLITHAAPDDDYAFIAPDTSEAEVRAKFADLDPGTTAVRGHHHLPFEHRLEGLHVISIGSAGLPLGGEPLAEYALVEPAPGGGWTAEHRQVRYDLAGALTAFETSGYLDEAGPVARLFYLEVASARHHLVPFLKRYAEWSASEQIDMDRALERYLELVERQSGASVFRPARPASPHPS